MFICVVLFLPQHLLNVLFLSNSLLMSVAWRSHPWVAWQVTDGFYLVTCMWLVLSFISLCILSALSNCLHFFLLVDISRLKLPLSHGVTSRWWLLILMYVYPLPISVCVCCLYFSPPSFHFIICCLHPCWHQLPTLRVAWWVASGFWF